MQMQFLKAGVVTDEQARRLGQFAPGAHNYLKFVSNAGQGLLMFTDEEKARIIRAWGGTPPAPLIENGSRVSIQSVSAAPPLAPPPRRLPSR